MPYVSAYSGFSNSILESMPNLLIKKSFDENKYALSSEMRNIFMERNSFHRGYVIGQATQIYIALDIISKTF